MTDVELHAAELSALAETVGALRARFETISKLRKPVVETDDIEAVHDMRVATRRLRSALGDLSPILKKKPRRVVNSELRKIAQTLGPLRDRDVEVAALEKLRGKTSDESIAAELDTVIKVRNNERQALHSDLSDLLPEAAIENLRTAFDFLLEEALRPVGGKGAKFDKRSRTAIIERINEFNDLSYGFYDPNNVADLHRLRIAAKRLRYSVELFAVPRDESFKTFAKAITEMQTYLGELHDADVWIERLGASLSKQESRARIWLLSEFVKERVKNYRGALELWSRWRDEGFLIRLQVALRSQTRPRPASAPLDGNAEAIENGIPG